MLRRAGIRFRALASRVEPPPAAGELPERYVRRAALAKALDVAARSPRGALVVGADTVVVAGGRILGKPRGRADAARMLRRLSGRTHRVMTGVCLVVAPRRRRTLFCETTRVRFRRLRSQEIRAYVASGEPLDKAGAYAIQAGAAKFVTHLEGGYSNVMGLPVARLCQVLERLGYGR